MYYLNEHEKEIRESIISVIILIIIAKIFYVLGIERFVLLLTAISFAIIIFRMYIRQGNRIY